MPQNAFLPADQLPADAPLDLQLDLLVDGELPEARRRTLLVSLDRAPDQWRGLAIRFLQQQTEKQSIRALMNGGKLVPVAIAKLPIKDMEMLLLKHVDDCSYQEIAERLGVTAGVVQMRLFRARQKLRELMLQQYPEV